MSSPLRYALVTPVRDEIENLPRLVGCILSQTVRPTRWVIVDTGSTDGTLDLAGDLAAEHDWIERRLLPGTHELDRGAPIVLAIHEGLSALAEREPPDVIVKLDADLSMSEDYFERLVDAFTGDSTLGIASGSCYEEEDGVWVERHMGARSVWGASRAYRWECLQLLIPLEAGIGWDGIDQLKANMLGWNTRILFDLPFHHHRLEGERDGSRLSAWTTAGRGSYYMGYRPSFLVLRALNAAREELSALAMIWGYAAAAIRRDPRCADVRVRTYLRDQQRLRVIPRRTSQALGHR